MDRTSLDESIARSARHTLHCVTEQLFHLIELELLEKSLLLVSVEFVAPFLHLTFFLVSLSLELGLRGTKRAVTPAVPCFCWKAIPRVCHELFAFSGALRPSPRQRCTGSNSYEESMPVFYRGLCFGQTWVAT